MMEKLGNYLRKNFKTDNLNKAWQGTALDFFMELKKANGGVSRTLLLKTSKFST